MFLNKVGLWIWKAISFPWTLHQWLTKSFVSGTLPLLDSIGLFEKTLKRATDWFFLVLGLIAGLCILSSIGEQLHISIYVEDVGSIPAGYVATEMWQAITFGFSFIIKHFFRLHTATGCWCIKPGSIPGTGIERR